MSGQLTGKVAVVTGAASGIGRATALLFAAEGARLVCFDRADEVCDTAHAIAEAGGEAIAIAGDAGTEADIEGLVAAALEKYGALHVFFANAGITGGVPGGIFDASPEIWAETLRVNLIGPFLAIKHALPTISKCGGGAIICTASAAGLRSGAGPANYSASKAGVISLVQTAAYQVAGMGVRINAIAPGLIETAMTRFVYDHARAVGRSDAIGRINPLLRGGHPEEIATAALFLASDAASYVHGQTLSVDGGLSASHPTVKGPAETRLGASASVSRGPKPSV